MNERNDNTVWAISWVSGQTYDRKRRATVDVVSELTIVGTQNVQVAVYGVLTGLVLNMGHDWATANELVRVQRKGYLQ